MRIDEILPPAGGTLHHVGIVCPDPILAESLLALAGANGSGGDGVAFRHVPEFACDCYLLGQLELVVPKGGSEAGGAMTPLERWLKGRGTSLHHIAFEVSGLEKHCASLRSEGVPVVLDEAVDGVAGIRVNFVHPSYCGFLIELVEQG